MHVELTLQKEEWGQTIMPGSASGRDLTLESAENRSIFRNLRKVVAIVVDSYKYNSKDVGCSHDKLSVCGVKGS